MTNQIQSTVGRDTVRSTAKLLFAALGVVFLAYLVGLLPGVDRLVPETPVTVAALVGVVLTAVIVALLVSIAPKLATVVRLRLDWPRAVSENVASVVYWLVILVAIIVAHRGFAGAVMPFVDGAVWLYDLVFLLIGLPAVVVIAVRLYASLDPAADLFADRVAGSEEP